MLIAALAFGAMRMPVHEGSLAHLQKQLANEPAKLAEAETWWNKFQAQQAAGESIDIHRLVEEHPEQALIIREAHQELVGHPLLTARQIFLLCGMLTIPVFIYIIVLIPQATIRFMAWLLTHTFYKGPRLRP